MDNIIPIFVVEAFTTGNNDPFTGNTAAICLLQFDDDVSDEVKQKIAMEMNLSETAFVSQGWTRENNLNSLETKRWTLRWFTPLMEVPLCGHASLAAARVVFHELLNNEKNGDKTTIQFVSKFRGILGATLAWDKDLITLNFPANPTIPISKKGNDWMSKLVEFTLGRELPLETVEEIHYSQLSKITVLLLKSTEYGHLANEELIRKVRPDFKAMLSIEGTSETPLHDVIVTIRGNQGNPEGPHFYSRFFAPWSGVDEDAVTGVAHTVLTPFWNQQFEKEGLNLKTFVAKQASQRGGKLICTLEGDRVHLTGSTRRVLKGSFLL